MFRLTGLFVFQIKPAVSLNHSPLNYPCTKQGRALIGCYLPCVNAEAATKSLKIYCGGLSSSAASHLSSAIQSTLLFALHCCTATSQLRWVTCTAYELINSDKFSFNHYSTPSGFMQPHQLRVPDLSFFLSFFLSFLFGNAE